MAIPLCRLEGTWQEITARIPDFDTRKLEVIIYDAEEEPQTRLNPKPQQSRR